MEEFDPDQLGTWQVLAAWLSLSGLGLLMVPVAVLLMRRLFPREAQSAVRFGGTDVVGVAGLVVFTLALGGLLITSLDTGWPVVVESLGISVMAFGSGAVAIVALARARHEDWREPLGLVRGRNLRAMLVGIGAYVVVTPLVFGLHGVWVWVLTRSGLGWSGQEVAREIRASEGGWLVVVVVWATAVQPLLEELIFRGFLQGFLVQRLGAAAGVVATSLLFAFLHGTSVLLPIFGLSVLLGLIRIQTGRLSAAWAVHGLHNSVMIAIMFAGLEASAGGT